VKAFRPVILFVPEGDMVPLTEGSTIIADSQTPCLEQGALGHGGEMRARAGFETRGPVKRFDQTFVKFVMVTREGGSVSLIGACAIKPINVFE